MERQDILNIIKKYLGENGYGDVTFDNGYGVVVFEKVKIFFYPGHDLLRITAIPTDRPYRIFKDINVEGEIIGNIFLKHQPNKTNSELMYDIHEKYLNEANINKVTIFLLNNTQRIFEEREEKR